MAKIWQKLESVSFVWDSTISKKVMGTNVVLLIWTDGKRRIPLGLRIWQKGGKSKLKLAEEMLWETRRRELTPMYVLFDAWYSGESLLNLLDKFGWKYCTRVKKNRLFEGVRIDKTFRHRYGRKIGNLKKIGYKILIVKDGERFLLTNNLELKSAEVKRIYPIRQQIEEVFRLLKQEFGWGNVGQIQYRHKRHICIWDCMLFVWCRAKHMKKVKQSMPTNKIYFANRYQLQHSSYTALQLLRNIS